MISTRTARGLLFLLAAGLLAAPAAAHTKPREAVAVKPAIIFPVVGEAQYADDFGDPRGAGRHGGNDIMAARRAPAVAAESGTVKFWTTSWSAGCMLYLYGDSGTTYIYIHLNNDRGAGNDNRGRCVPGVAYAPGLADGARVVAGELVGFVGDSGDADGLNPHLHFEVHPGAGAAVNPLPFLKRARMLDAPVAAAVSAGAAVRRAVG